MLLCVVRRELMRSLAGRGWISKTKITCEEMEEERCANICLGKYLFRGTFEGRVNKCDNHHIDPFNVWLYANKIQMIPTTTHLTKKYTFLLNFNYHLSSSTHSSNVLRPPPFFLYIVTTKSVHALTLVCFLYVLFLIVQTITIKRRRYADKNKNTIQDDCECKDKRARTSIGRESCGWRKKYIYHLRLLFQTFLCAGWFHRTHFYEIMNDFTQAWI